MTEHTQPCAVCKGHGKQTLRVSTHGEPGENVMQIDCVWCKGEGRMTPQQAADHEFYQNMWCKCDDPHEHLAFWDDGEHPEVHKHHWRCRACHKVVQLG